MSKWKTLDGVEITDILQWVREAAADGREVHIGTDSLQSGKRTHFVTVVVLYNKGKGGRVAQFRESVPRIQSLRERLMQETWRSVDLGLTLSPVIPGELTVHIDANTVQTHKSSKFAEELVGLVVGQGFKALLKPEAFVATHVADHCVRAGLAQGVAA